jgi:hypothetical protein
MKVNQPRLVPVPSSDLEAIVGQYLDKIGVPISTVRAEALFRVTDGKRNLVRVLFDYFDETGSNDFDQQSETSAPGTAEKLICTVSQRQIRRRPDAQSYFATGLPVFKELAFANSKHWYVSPKVLSPGDFPLWALDSRSRWPSWAFVGTTAEFDFHLPETRTFTSSEGLDTVEESVFGAHRSPYTGLVPCALIRIQQRLVRIADNRLVTDGPIEAVTVRLEVGQHADGFLARDGVRVHYAFYNAAGEEFMRNTVEFDTTQRDRQIELPGKAGARINTADVEVYLGDVLLDWSSGPYIREIKVNVSFV